MQRYGLAGGVSDIPRGEAYGFRAALRAMGRPGTIEVLKGAEEPAPLSPAASALLLILCDQPTGLHIAPSHHNHAVRDWITFQTSAPDYPDRSVTLIIGRPELQPPGAVLRGPGIEHEAALDLPELAAFRANRAQFPLGFGAYLTAGSQVAGLPRSTQVTAD
ncbi:phosphonate C-P lyase system protein PhnH [Gymnodinialimonas sp. 2305UL16-5]|uniref:phosphonate C-P lyase system protein PhnH n=1 Tax=Gymnodinialimonas mytili TaxID=3126503 RepID=UPI0030A3092D